jgi:hypothetical protein
MDPRNDMLDTMISYRVIEQENTYLSDSAYAF